MMKPAHCRGRIFAPNVRSKSRLAAFDYRITGGDENMRPVRVMDDGRKTFIQMTANAANREAPVLVVVGPSGPEMVNYRVKGDMYIVDRLFERGALILGAGKKARRVEVIRGTYRGKGKKP